MDPIFTILWEEYHLAQQLQKSFSKKDGFSVFVPASRQEEGIDFGLIHRPGNGKTRCVTFQVKRSRTYPGAEPKRATTRNWRHNLWFNRFAVSDRADFFLLFSTYPDFNKKTNKWVYKHIVLMFSNEEMRSIMSECKTVKGTMDKMFGFGFDDGKDIFFTRGDPKRGNRSFRKYFLEYRLDDIKAALR